MKRIKEGQLRFLVATDVAARGIDISDLSHVISYSTSDAPEVYVHRTGRTGRAGRKGVAISLVSGLDIGNFKHMQNVNKVQVAERKPPTDEELSQRVSERLMAKFEQKLTDLEKTGSASQADRLLPLVESLAADLEGRRTLARICAAYLHDPLEATESTESPDADPSEASAPPARRSGGRGKRRGGGGKSGPPGGNRGGGRDSSRGPRKKR